jgi:membrane protease YdiL (CAAX protease family)
VFGSILWAAWHFPAYYPHAKSFLRLFMEIGPISFIQIVLGPVLCFCARRSRTLVPSAAIHAVGNAYALTLMK